MEPILVVASRYLHVIAAVCAVGGAVFIRFVLPAGLAQADAGSRDAVFLRCRKVFKIIVHASVTFLLLTGVYNALRNWNDYKLVTPKGLAHGLFGGHALLGVIVIAVSLWLLAPAQPRAGHKKWMGLNVGLMFVLILLASTLNFVRTSAIKAHVPAAPVVPTVGE
ncbi:MAG: hypothetical protein ACAI43_17290 [Phycisphaerae bacterium]|nr:hypothetical protein [Tepidisphaeraceae bacterium]